MAAADLELAAKTAPVPAELSGSTGVLLAERLRRAIRARETGYPTAAGCRRSLEMRAASPDLASNW
jgi:hypothetical protein